MLKIFISVGEHSGDLLGAHLMRSLKDELDASHNLDFQGISRTICLLAPLFLQIFVFF